MFAETIMAMAAAPAPNIAMRAMGYERTPPRTSSSAPSPRAPMTMIAGRGRSSDATRSAAVSDPSPIEAIRNPSPVAPTPSTVWASAGATTLKFIANVETSPTRTTASRTTGVART